MRIPSKHIDTNVLKAKHTFRYRLLKALAVTMLAFLISWIVAQPFSLSLNTLISNQDKRDFNITNVYNIVANSRPVRTLEKDIVIVDIDHADRNDITDLLNVLSIMEPEAVGLDVTFNEHRDNDSLLLSAISSIPNMVLASTLGGGQDNSWFYDKTRQKHNYGFVNLPSNIDGGIIREFPTWLTDSVGNRGASFAVAIIEKIAPEAIEKLSARGHEFEAIDYPSHEFLTLQWDEVPDHPQDISGKIVLIGDNGDSSDMHYTPLNKKMSGVMIHACALCTMLNDHYQDTIPKWVNILLAWVLCFIMSFVSISINSPIKGLTLRLIQVALLYLILRIGYWLFIDEHIILDFSYSLLMLTFVFFAIDIWDGLRYLYKKLKTKICHKSNHESSH